MDPHARARILPGKHQFSLTTLFALTTWCAIIAALSGMTGTLAAAALMGLALALFARSGGLALAMMLTACIAADFRWPSGDDQNSILRQAVILVVVASLCCWQRWRQLIF